MPCGVAPRACGSTRRRRSRRRPEFAGKALDQGAWLNGAEIDFSRPGKPTDDALIEAFNSRLRAECLNASWFLSMADARDRIGEWRCAYNEDQPHSALGNLTPRAFADQAHQARRVAWRLDLNRGRDQRAVATRYEKTASSFMGVLCLAATMDWLKN